VPEAKKLADVYGISRDIPLTYVTRPYVDDKLVNSLTRDKHIVVFGGSKQGKTCLRKHSLTEDDCIVLQCNASSTRAVLYEMMLKYAGASVTVTEKRSISGTNKVEVSVEAKAKIPFIGEAGGSGKGSRETGTDWERSRQDFEIDPSDPNDVIRVLQAAGFEKYIVLEDFHYLPEDVQREIAIDLKAFHEQSKLCFIIVGVWLESTKLVVYNGDLAGRLVPVDADHWERDDLLKVIEKGEPLLNIEFPRNVKDEVLESCQGNVGILQDTCYRLCETAGVMQTPAAKKMVGTPEEVTSAVRDIAAEHAGRYRNFLEQFKDGLQAGTELQMYKWIAYVVVTSPPHDLKRGLSANFIFRQIDAVHTTHHGRVAVSSVSQALERVGKVQQKHRVQPIILDYESNEGTLRVTDSGFILFIASQPRSTLLDLIDMKDPKRS